MLIKAVLLFFFLLAALVSGFALGKLDSTAKPFERDGWLTTFSYSGFAMWVFGFFLMLALSP